MECFLETGKTVERFPAIHLCESEVILHHLCDNFFYGCESWVLSLDMESKSNAFAISCYRIMLGISQKAVVTALLSMKVLWAIQEDDQNNVFLIKKKNMLKKNRCKIRMFIIIKVIKGS